MEQATFGFGDDGAIFRNNEVVEAVRKMSEQSDSSSRGAIFTRKEVVNFILDLVLYKDKTKKLFERRVLEPSFGNGDFLFPIIKRLIASWKMDGGNKSLKDCIRGVELHSESYEVTREKVKNCLADEGFSQSESRSLADCWLLQDDFLLTNLEGKFDFVVGNPPYLRQEMIPDVLLKTYRKNYKTIYDRADIYVPFIERSLSLLKQTGKLGFICADRWMKNRYGGPLRKLIHDGYHLETVVDMVDAKAFHEDVTAYPAITVVAKRQNGATNIARPRSIEPDQLCELARRLTVATPAQRNSDIKKIETVTNGSHPWILDSSADINLIRRLESTYPKLEEAGCRVGIGVATGADKVYIADFDSLDVEEDRKLRLATTKDVVDGEISWRGKGVINPFLDDGTLVDLARYPKLASYLDKHKEAITKRHVAKKNPKKWFRTIDRITPTLASQAKLLIPDIKGEAHVAYEHGELYPHHNLYYVTSADWNLRALQAVLRSSIAELFVSAYSTKMRGGYLRFQAQYLRRICIPEWQSVPTQLQRKLSAVAEKGDAETINSAIAELYKLSETEKNIIRLREKECQSA